jgi:hypothetical protein
MRNSDSAISLVRNYVNTKTVGGRWFQNAYFDFVMHNFVLKSAGKKSMLRWTDEDKTYFL